MTAKNPDVIVAGAGPVGLAMACELLRYGVSVRIVDRAGQRTDQSRALVVWSRTLELIDRLGIGPAFVAAGLKGSGASIFAGNRRVAQINLDVAGTPHPYALLIPQSETERLLEDHLRARGGQVERQTELTHLVARADGVEVTLRRADGTDETVAARWLVGCDGAHSTVRHVLGMPFAGDTLASDWLLADMHLSGLQTRPDELTLFWHAQGLLAMFPMPGGRTRVVADVALAPDQDPHGEPTMAEIQAVLDQRGPGGVRAFEPVWLSRFRINERKVADYRSGTVFLAGDAAHVHSPAGGQGMNTGLQDAFNLAWKLALVCRGLAEPEPLLGSYSLERSPIGAKVLAGTGRLTAIATLRGRMLQATRNELVSVLFGLGPVRRAASTALAELSLGYPDSPLTEGGRHGASGQRAPVSDAEQPVGAGDTPRFAVLGDAGEGGLARLARHEAVLEDRLRPAAAHDELWLVRPDGYVAVAARGGDWGRLDAYLGRVTGRAPAHRSAA